MSYVKKSSSTAPTACGPYCKDEQRHDGAEPGPAENPGQGGEKAGRGVREAEGAAGREARGGEGEETGLIVLHQ